MLYRIFHISLICLTTVTAFLLQACGSDAPAPDAIGPDGTSTTHLAMSVRLLDSDDRNLLTSLSDNEKIHSLRVVILDAQKKVEHNRYINMGDKNAVTEYGYLTDRDLIFKVKAHNDKTIYIFANEEWAGTKEDNLTAKFDAFTEGMDGFAAMADAVVFTPRYNEEGSYLPMSARYDVPGVDIDPGHNEDNPVVKQFRIVRTATKFTFNFVNKRTEQVKINSITVRHTVDRTYLMPHLNEKAALFGGEFWIDWLHRVSLASNVDPYNPSADAAGWITDYTVPADTVGVTYTTGALEIEPSDGKVHGKAVMPTFYLSESRRLKPADNPDDMPVIPDEQEYWMEIDVDGIATFTRAIPNLRALFRNTHVFITIGLDYADNSVYARIVDWEYVPGIVEGNLQEEQEDRHK